IVINKLWIVTVSSIKKEKSKLVISNTDVVCKSVPSALSMSMIKYSLYSLDSKEDSTKRILKQLNRVVEQNIASNMFITLFFVEFNPTRNLLTYASAGHEPGFFYN